MMITCSTMFYYCYYKVLFVKDEESMMDYNLKSEELFTQLSHLDESKVFTAVGLRILDVPNRYEVKRWVSYVVPVTKHWTPWTNPEGRLDYDYRTWRFIQLEQELSEFTGMLHTWINNDYHMLVADVSTRMTIDTWERQRTWSHQTDNSRRTVPFPTMWYHASNSSDRHQLDHDLVALGLPYFPSTKEAFASLIDGVDLRIITNRSLEGSTHSVFILDDQPFVEKVSLDMSGCKIVVEGSVGKECELKVFDDSSTNYIQQISQPGEYSVEWSGIPDYAVFALTRGSELLDKIVYSRQPYFGGNQNIEVNLDKETTLEILVESGEGPHIEFKDNLPKDKNDKEFMETVCAFANTNDGIIIVGVSDRGDIHGVGTDLPEKYEEILSNKIRNTIDPVPPITIETQNYHGSWVILVKVKKGDAVYALNATSIPVCYKRHGSNDFPAKLSELHELFSSVNQSPPLLNIGGVTPILKNMLH